MGTLVAPATGTPQDPTPAPDLSTAKFKALDVPAEVVTVTLSVPSPALAAIVMVTVSFVSLTTTLFVSGTPVPVMAAVPPVNPVPLMVRATVLPCTPLVGFNEIRTGAGVIAPAGRMATIEWAVALEVEVEVEAYVQDIVLAAGGLTTPTADPTPKVVKVVVAELFHREDCPAANVGDVGTTSVSSRDAPSTDVVTESECAVCVPAKTLPFWLSTVVVVSVPQSACAPPTMT